MNKSFKVVFSKARSALMVVNEATSSIQAKGTKTVIAAAAAAMIAGGAVAEEGSAATTPTVVTEATVTGSLVWTPDATESSKSHYAGTDVTVVAQTGDAAAAWNETKHTIGNSTAMKLAGGQFVAAGKTEGVGAMTGNGVITWDATKDAVGSLTANGINLDKGEINIGVYDGKTEGSQKNSTVTSSAQLNVAEGTLHTYVAAAETGAVKHGIATLSATGAVTLGTAAVEGLSAGKDFNINSEVATNVSGTSVTYKQGSITNTADLKISAGAASAGGSETEAVKFEKAVKIAKNTGSITLAGEKVVFNSDYTAGGDNSGKLILKGTTKNSIGGAVKASSVMLGTYAADNADQKTVEVVLDGPTTVVESGASVEAGNLWFADADKALTVAGTLTADTTKVSASGAAVTVSDQATASLGDITIEAAPTANNLSVTNQNAKADVTAKSLTIAAADKTNTAVGTFTLTSGAFTVGDLSNASGAKVAVGSDNAKSVFTVTGKATNAGTIELTGAAANNTTTFVVGADSAFTNTGSIAEAQSKPGTLDVAGQLTNTGAGTITLTNLVVSGTLTTGVVTLDRDGAETTTKAFKFDSITLDKGGVINVVADASGNALKTFYTETKDKDGKVTKTAKIHDGVWNFNGGNVQVNGTTIAGADYDVVMGGSAALTANFAADYEFGNVSAAENSQKVTLSVTDAANLKAKSVDLTKAGTDSVVNVKKGAALTTDKLTVAGAKVELTDGTLTVNNVLTTSANSGTITVDGGSTLNVSAQALGFVDKNGALNLTAASLTTAESTLGLSNGAKFNVTGLDGQTLKTGVLSKIQGLRIGSMGQINLGNVTVTSDDGKGYVTDGKISYSVVNTTLGGIVTDDIANATVTGVEATGFTNGGSFKDLQMKIDAAVTVAQNTTLTLNGTGDLVTFTSTATDTTPAKTSLQGVSLASGAAFVTTGAGAVIGSVTKEELASGTNFGVEGTGSLTVKGNVDVGKLYTDAGAAVTVVKSDAKDAVASTVTVDTLEIDGAFTAADSVVTLNGSGTYTATTPASAKGLAYVAGKALVKELSTSGDMFVTGTLDVTTKLSAAAGKTVYVGNEKSAGVLSVGSLESGKIFADPAWVDGKSAGASLVAVKTVAAAATVEAGRNSIVSLGTANVNDGVAALAKSGFTLADTPAVDDPATGVKAVDAMDTKTVNSVIYVNGGKTATTVATAIAGNVAANANSAAETVSNVNIAENSMLAIDMNTVATDGSVAVFEKDVTLNGVLYLDNVTNGQTVKLTAGGLETSNKGIDALFEGDMLMSAVQDATDSSKITVQMDAKSDIAMAGVSLPGFDAAYGMFAEGKNVGNNSTSAKFNKWLYSTGTSPVMVKTSDGHTDVDMGALSRIATDVASLGATTGVQTMTMDAVNQMGETVAD
ncbi:ESPR-type extended signal peptide-containing protein, partial [Duodenibacillus massiliensis]|uniref:ESPR-type extended signal peptide-containing protein n=1 Tax=Duodenibacillus massiliensis TaxID=1852381 RepID=UPI00307B2461